MVASPARLVVRHGPKPNQEHALVLNTNIIGREPINDVVFADAEVSRRHARIILQNGHYYIEDLGSTNGTFVNGRRIHAITKLGNGDIVDLGESVRVTFVQEQGDETAHAPVMAPPAPASTATVQIAAPVAPAAAPAPAPAYENHQATRRNMYFLVGGIAAVVLLCSCVSIYVAVQYLGLGELPALFGGGG